MKLSLPGRKKKSLIEQKTDETYKKFMKILEDSRRYNDPFAMVIAYSALLRLMERTSPDTLPPDTYGKLVNIGHEFIDSYYTTKGRATPEAADRFMGRLKDLPYK